MTLGLEKSITKATMEALLNKMYADDNINGDKSQGKWGDQSDLQYDESERMYNNPPLAYTRPTFTQDMDGQFYFGYPISMMQTPCLKNAIYVPCYSKTDSDMSSETTEPEISEFDLGSEFSEEEGECEDLMYAGKFVYHAKSRDASKNYGFIVTEKPIMSMTRFITFDVPQKCKLGDTVRFNLVHNKRGKDAYKAMIM